MARKVEGAVNFKRIQRATDMKAAAKAHKAEVKAMKRRNRAARKARRKGGR